MPSTDQKKITNRAIRRAFGAEALETIAQTVDKVNLHSQAIKAFGAETKKHHDILTAGFFGRLRWLLFGPAKPAKPTTPLGVE